MYQQTRLVPPGSFDGYPGPAVDYACPRGRFSPFHGPLHSLHYRRETLRLAQVGNTEFAN